MKRLIVCIISLMLLIGLAACGREAETVVMDSPAPTAGSPEPTVAQEPGINDSAVTVALYIPNDNADGFNVAQVDLPELTAEELVKALVAAGVFPEGVAVNSFEFKGDYVPMETGYILGLDMNSAFGAAMQGTGTAGEYMLMGSLTDTFMDAFDAVGIDLTVDGQVLETGHSIYDFTLGWMD